MRNAAAWLVLILVFDWLAYKYVSYDLTLTGIIRGWQDQTILAEVVFWLCVVALNVHLFRRAF